MSLSDRLQRARTQQLIEAGLVPADYVPEAELEPIAEVEPDVDLEPTSEAGTGLFAPVTIEVKPVGLHLVPALTVDLSDAADNRAENDGRCPNCYQDGVVDMVDLVGHTVHYTCGTCSTMWHVRKPAVHDPVA